MVQVEILDSNLSVVGYAILSGGNGPVQSLSLSSSTFVPETQGQLEIFGNQGATGYWKGVGNNGDALPDGFYHVYLMPSGSSNGGTSFWLQHVAYSDGSVSIGNNPVRGSDPLTVEFTFSQTVNLEFYVYDIAGELVAKRSVSGSNGTAAMVLRSVNGGDVGPGIYLLQVRGQVVSSGSQIRKTLKLAVVR